MGFQALLFCPDEKTARSVTQVLSELEFSVEPCNEPFAAVKKLMGTHFDAIVVDCDNEQNAALLFKSARNSMSNQSSLAVAVVEGQAGVAKAFRIGANLVLTKPINIEQAKGTLRVARGLLRKGDPAKPSASAPAAVVPTKVPASPAATSTAPAPRPGASAVTKPVSGAARPAQAASASSTVVAGDQPGPAIKDSSHPAAAGQLSVAPPAIHRASAPFPAAAKPAVSAASPVPASGLESRSALKPAAPASSAPFGSGAASAPAPAREILDIPPTEAKPATAPSEDDNILDTTAAEKPRQSAEPAKDVPPPLFTFGGANAPAESSVAKKIVLGIAAAVVVAAGSYFGWTYYQGHVSHPINGPVNGPAPATVAAPVAPKPSGGQPLSAPSTVAPSSQPASQPAVNTPAPATGAVKPANHSASDEEDTAGDVPPPSKPAASASSPASKTPPAEAPASVPMVVKGGTAPTTKVAPAAPDTPAPSMLGLATPGASGPLPNLGSSNTPKPVLQRLNVSQGVSTGLLIKRVDPVYPPGALHLRIQGTVQLLATISKDGSITQVQVLSGEKQLIAAAVDAVKRWKYKPYLLNGEPVEIQTQVTMTFKLPQ